MASDGDVVEVPSPVVVARCEACGLGYEFDDLRRLVDGSSSGVGGDGPVFVCGDCGGPVYAIDPDDVVEGSVVELVELIEDCSACMSAGGECEFHRGWGAGWDACVEVVAGWVQVAGVDGSSPGGEIG